jgi:hypothetical protein
MGTLKSQRDRTFPELNQNSYLNTCNKQILEEHLLSLEMPPSSSEQVLEYERKIKEHLLKIEARCDSKVSQLELVIDAKNAIIEECTLLAMQ